MSDLGLHCCSGLSAQVLRVNRVMLIRIPCTLEALDEMFESAQSFCMY